MSFFEELKRRSVVRVAILYGVATWLILQIADVLFPNLGAPDSRELRDSDHNSVIRRATAR